MKAQECNLPVLPENYYFLANRKKEKDTSKYKKIAIITAFLFLISIFAVLGVIFFSEINELRLKVHLLESSLKEIQAKLDDSYIDNIVESKLGVGDDLDQQIASENSILDDSENDSYDYNYYDDDEEVPNAIVLTNIDTKQLLTGENLTKDFKDNEDSSRTRRNIIGYTEDEIPINSEFSATTPSYQSPTHHKTGWHEKDVNNTTPTLRHHVRKSRVMHHQNQSKHLKPVVSKIALKSGDDQGNSEENPDVDFTVVTENRVGGRGRHRSRYPENFDETSRHPRTGRMRPLPTAHFSGDTSTYVLGQHENFHGNGRLRHPKKTFVDWKESYWFRTLGMDRHFSLDEEGSLLIKEAGLYFVYAQIFYYDERDLNGFRVYKNGDILLQCTTTTHSVEKVMKGNTCYTAGAEYLHAGDLVALGDLSDNSYSIFEPGKSFFGVIKLGDVKIK